MSSATCERVSSEDPLVLRSLLLEAGVLFFIVLAVMAGVFRSVWARDMLRFARNVGWVYVGLVVVFAAVQIARR